MVILMSLNDMMMMNMYLNYFNKIDTGYYFIDLMISITTISSIIAYFVSSNVKDTIYSKITKLLAMFNNENTLLFSSSNNESSKKYRSIMYHISKINNHTIKTLREMKEMKYNYHSDNYEETPASVYRVEQSNEFLIDLKNELYGVVYNRNEEKSENNGKTNYVEHNYLEIFSKKMKLTEMEKWVEDCVDEYTKYLRIKSCDKQQLIEVSWNPERSKIEIYNNPWESNVTFENRFFEKKDEIISKIKFFIENPNWYKQRGIPYTLGFLLWGKPGCGKTGFIKALMNMTGRHGVSTKLNNEFDLNKLREIIYDDEIYEDLIIPQNNRILVFEDVDCMGDIIKDRELKEKEKEAEKNNKDSTSFTDLTNMSKDTVSSTAPIKNKDEKFNNNLSFLLNILDGLHECPGRIIIMTTNKPELLDKALIRPGRIDYNINFTNATIKDIKNIISFYWSSDCGEIPDELNEKYSHAEIVNFCRTTSSKEETMEKLLKSV
jgi:ATP-dependent 26S proteasome regulatory subunit